MLMPRQPVPALTIPTLDHGAFDLSARTPESFTLLVFYRGLHCPICANYLKDMEKHVGALAERGVEAIAVSSDTAERARAMADKIEAKALTIGYGLPLTVARDWGLYVSTSRGLTSIGIEEPALFSEPGLFLVRPDGTLYYGQTQTMPFARPHFAELLGALDFARKVDYPARGEYQGEL